MKYQYQLTKHYLRVRLASDTPLDEIPTIYEEICLARPQVARVQDVNFERHQGRELPKVGCWYCGSDVGLSKWTCQNAHHATGQPVGEAKEYQMCQEHTVVVKASLALREAGNEQLADSLDNWSGIETRPRLRIWREVNST